MMRLLLFLGLVALLYWVLHHLSRKAAMGPPPNRPTDDAPVDELVQDPVCGVYHPKRRAFRLKRNDKTYYFCSKNCLELFEKQEHGS